MNAPYIGTDGGPFGDGETSTAVIRAVAERTGTDPTELPPLYEVIDPDALDSIFATTATGTIRRGRLEFVYAGCSIVVSSEDGIEVNPTSVDTYDESTEPDLSVE